MGKILVIHGGAPTQVINASLYGVIDEARKINVKDEILASDGGVSGILKGNLINITNISNDDLERLKFSPGSAIGTGRDHLEEDDYEKILSNARKAGIDKIIFNGGNGTMDTAEHLSRLAQGSSVTVVGIPKTMDNDLSITDHSPGYGSAALYLSTAVRDVSMDVKGLAIHVVIIEAFGRDAGWVAASSALARNEKDSSPDLILLPEVPFDKDKFLNKVESLYREKGEVIVVASEGLKDDRKLPIVPPIFEVGRSVYYGDVSSHLASLVIKELGIKARSEKPGLISRSSSFLTSPIDRLEAIECGRTSLRALLEKRNGEMSIIKRISNEPYKVEYSTHKIDEEILKERIMPDEYINKNDFDVTDSFIDYVKPLIGASLPQFFTLRRKNG